MRNKQRSMEKEESDGDLEKLKKPSKKIARSFRSSVVPNSSGSAHLHYCWSITDTTTLPFVK